MQSLITRAHIDPYQRGTKQLSRSRFARFSKRSLSLFILLLIFGVAAREVPEYLSLTDDVSNDGIVATYCQQGAPDESSLRNARPEMAGARRDRLLAPAGLLLLAANCNSLHRAKPGQGLLLLLSLQRK
jgi:hypothetical protein